MRMLLGCAVIAFTLAAAAGDDRIAFVTVKPDASDEFFDKAAAPRLRVDLDKSNLDALKRDPRKYVHGTVREGDQPFNDVAIHIKGAAGSFRGWDDKPALTLNMDKFAKGQRYHALDKLHLNNSVQDPAYLSEAVCGELMRAAGVPAARTTHATVELNGRKVGLYVVKEGFDKTFLKRYFKNVDGNFYDSGFLQDINGNLKNSAEDGNDVKDHADLKALAKASQERDPAKRFATLEKLLDLDGFLALLAMETFTWHWDGYAMKANNYRVYHDPDTNKLVFVAHGMDQMFWDPNGPINPGFGGMVARGLLDTPEGKKRYRAKMAEIMEKVVVWTELEKRIDFHHKRARTALEAVDKNAAGNLDGAVKRLKEAVKQRIESVNRQLKK